MRTIRNEQKISDLVSRQVALDEIDKNRQTLLSLGMNEEEYILFHYGRRVIEELPIIDTDKHGKWISAAHKKNRICSICGGDEPYKFADEDVDVFDYCPYCGAKMDE